MSYHNSSSESEDESHRDRETSQNTQQHIQRDPKYQCPADFVAFKYSSSASALLNKDEHTELWLIKAPSRFNPESLSGMKVSLSGLEMIQSTGQTTPQIYSVLGSYSGPTDLHLLTSSHKNQDVSLSASGFTGILSISESYGDCSGNQGPIAVPAAPAPTIPPGLKQRFQPFGSSTPAYTAQTSCSASASVSPSPPKRARLHQEESDEQRKRKKKKKKEKHSREDHADFVNIKQEMSHEYSELQTPEPVEEGETTEKRKKKKVKKEKESGDIPDQVDGSFVAKEEPMDPSYGDMDGSVKKKKKKKKKKKTLDE